MKLMINEEKANLSGEPGSSVHFERDGESRTLSCHPGEPILLAGLRQGMALPYECATGNCGLCRARRLAGEVHSLWPEAPGAAACGEDEVLLCQAVAGNGARIEARPPIPGHGAPVAPDHQDAIVERLWRPDPVTLVLELRLPRPSRHHGGQYVLLALPGVPGYRAYSIANHADGGPLRLIVRRKPDGLGTATLFEAIRDGDTLPLYGPLGRACLAPENDQDLAFIVGGSGISLATGVIEHALASGHFRHHQGRLFFGVRGPEQCFFAERLEEYAQRAHGNLFITVVFSDADVPAGLAERHPRLHFATGFVHEIAGQALSTLSNDATTAFVAGPPPMVEGVLRVLLMKAGIPPARIRYDKFT